VGLVLYFGGGCVIVIYFFFSFKCLGLNNVGIHSPLFSSK
jgi:hypothetical protein